jgi:bifunctional DNA-binding transcriptional regulator/antitoxin component of YhaV-PrlF toxin-antitoxin module
VLIQVERRLFRIGEGAIAVTLPKAWTRYHHLEPGDRIEIIADEDLIIKVKNKKSDEQGSPDKQG